MVCDNCIKNDVCNQKEIMETIIKTFNSVPIALNKDDNIYMSNVTIKHGISYNVNCDKYKAAQINIR